MKQVSFAKAHPARQKDVHQHCEGHFCQQHKRGDVDDVRKGVDDRLQGRLSRAAHPPVCTLHKHSRSVNGGCTCRISALSPQTAAAPRMLVSESGTPNRRPIPSVACPWLTSLIAVDSAMKAGTCMAIGSKDLLGVHPRAVHSCRHAERTSGSFRSCIETAERESLRWTFAKEWRRRRVLRAAKRRTGKSASRHATTVSAIVAGQWSRRAFSRPSVPPIDWRTLLACSPTNDEKDVLSDVVASLFPTEFTWGMVGDGNFSLESNYSG